MYQIRSEETTNKFKGRSYESYVIKLNVVLST